MKHLLDRFDHYFIDLWGVLWDGKHNYPEALEFCRRLLDEGRNVLFLSNTSEHVVEEIVERLRQAGLAGAMPDCLATSGQAMELWFARNGLKGRPVYVFGGEGMWENVRRAGSEPIDMPKRGLDIKGAAKSDCLVVGGLLDFDWKRMMEIVTGVSLGGLRVVLPNPDMVVVEQTGRVHLPAGMVAHVIEAALPGLKVERIGKPYPFIYEYAFSRVGNGARRDRTLMIGDSLATDVRGANNAGIASLLLGQGVHLGQSLDQIRRQARDLRVYPDFYIERLSPDTEIMELDWRLSNESPGSPQ